MSVILKDAGIFYASVPKIACTSVKRFFFEIENGYAFRKIKINGSARSIHKFYKGLAREDFPESRIEGLHKVALVRDPLSRFLSAYSNRVRHHRELSPKKAGAKLAKVGLEPDPDIGAFIDNFDTYREAHPSIKHHTRPITDFLGTDPGFFDKIYRMSEISDFEKDMNEKAGTDVTMPHAQRGGPRVSKDELTDAQIGKVKAIYEKDYAAFSDYF